MDKAVKTSDSGLQNQLKAVRTRLGLSQAELAQAAGITRQTIGGIEGALYAPSAAVALRLAKALGCRVEELFWLEDSTSPEVEVKLAAGAVAEAGERVLLGKVGDQWVGHPLKGQRAFRLEMVPADGEMLESGKVRVLDTPESLERTVLVAGCAPALSLWTRSAERWHPGLRAAWIFANSTEALAALGREEVHIAGIHLIDRESGEENEGFVARLQEKTGSQYALVNFGVWEEGFAVAVGNPKGIGGVEDLKKAKVRLVNREEGAGGRILLDNEISRAGIGAQGLRGYENEVRSHHAIAESILNGEADYGVVPQAVAEVYGLDFVPLRKVRFDLVMTEGTLLQESVKQLLGTLEHKTVRQQLQLLGGLETERSGEILARIGQ